MVIRGLFVRCPACGGGKVHNRVFKMKATCPTCTLKFERIFGHSLGYVGLNTIVTFTATFFVILIGSILTYQDGIKVGPLIAATLCTTIILPILFLPTAHTLWTAFDLIWRPLEPGEIDPRFIKIDPEGGAWVPDHTAGTTGSTGASPDGATGGSVESDDRS